MRKFVCKEGCKRLIIRCRLVNRHWCRWATCQIKTLQPKRTAAVDHVLESIATNFTHLQSLTLHSATSVTDWAPLVKIPAIRHESRLGVRFIYDNGLQGLRRLSALRYLTLMDCHCITNDGMKTLAALTNLSALRLEHGVKVRNKGVWHLVALEALSSLMLNDFPKLTDEAVRRLSVLTNLTQLAFANCPCITLSLMQSVAMNESPADCAAVTTVPAVTSLHVGRFHTCHFPSPHIPCPTLCKSKIFAVEPSGLSMHPSWIFDPPWFQIFNRFRIQKAQEEWIKTVKKCVWSTTWAVSSKWSWQQTMVDSLLSTLPVNFLWEFAPVQNVKRGDIVIRRNKCMKRLELMIMEVHQQHCLDVKRVLPQRERERHYHCKMCHWNKCWK